MTLDQFTVAMLYSIPACLLGTWIIVLAGYRRKFSLRLVFVATTLVALFFTFGADRDRGHGPIAWSEAASASDLRPHDRHRKCRCPAYGRGHGHRKATAVVTRGSAADRRLVALGYRSLGGLQLSAQSARAR